MKNLNSIFICLLMAGLTSCTQQDAENTTATSPIIVASYGKMPDGAEIKSYTLTNAEGLEMTVINYGGIITSLKVPDKDGNLGDIALGYDSLSAYMESNPYFGAIIGRYGNRIANGKFSLDGVEYPLAVNNGPNHLHGGVLGFDKVVWDIKESIDENGPGLILNYKSKDMEEGYPGNLDITITYKLTNGNTLDFDYTATTDKKTIVNLTQHTYFNLSAMKRDILDHELHINAPTFLPVNSGLIPTGELRPVADTPFDFTTAKAIGRDIGVENEQLKFGNGFDHNWVLNKSEEGMTFAGSLHDKESGRFMEVYTEEPGMQFYSGNFLDGKNIGKENKPYAFRSGLCLETQHYPDSPNQPGFPSVILNPGEKYHTKTVYKFAVK